MYFGISPFLPSFSSEDWSNDEFLLLSCRVGQHYILHRCSYCPYPSLQLSTLLSIQVTRQFTTPISTLFFVHLLREGLVHPPNSLELTFYTRDDTYFKRCVCPSLVPPTTIWNRVYNWITSLFILRPRSL